MLITINVDGDAVEALKGLIESGMTLVRRGETAMSEVHDVIAERVGQHILDQIEEQDPASYEEEDEDEG